MCSPPQSRLVAADEPQIQPAVCSRSAPASAQSRDPFLLLLAWHPEVLKRLTQSRDGRRRERLDKDEPAKMYLLAVRQPRLFIVAPIPVCPGGTDLPHHNTKRLPIAPSALLRRCLPVLFRRLGLGAVPTLLRRLSLGSLPLGHAPRGRPAMTASPTTAHYVPSLRHRRPDLRRVVREPLEWHLPRCHSTDPVVYP